MVNKIKEVKKKKVKRETVTIKIKKPKDNGLSEIAKKRNALIDEIKPKLLSNKALKSGGSNTRARYDQEQRNYLPVIQEINDLGRQLKIRDIGLGHLRK